MIELSLKQMRADAVRLRRECRKAAASIAYLQDVLSEKQHQLQIVQAVLKNSKFLPRVPHAPRSSKLTDSLTH
jgi:hypothetical protein